MDFQELYGGLSFCNIQVDLLKGRRSACRFVNLNLAPFFSYQLFLYFQNQRGNGPNLKMVPCARTTTDQCASEYKVNIYIINAAILATVLLIFSRF